jgi:hypothetical protein
MAEEALIKKAGDKYRSFLHDEAENITQWRHGGPPIYDSVNQLFEEGRTKVIDSLLFFSFPLSLYMSKLGVRVCVMSVSFASQILCL